MSPEKQRIAIAEVCGWKPYRYEDGGIRWYIGIHHENSVSLENLPDYLNDLNACHEMEESLSESQRHDYASKLARYFKELYPLGYYFITDFDMIHATAPQRCEAFLKTIEKWEGEK